MKVKQLDNLIERVKIHFKEYLKMHDTVFTNTHFTCPNRAEHKNDDGVPSAAEFPPDCFKCFSCQASGDIFTAAEYLEGKPITGPGFITDNVLYLADLFDEPYEVADRTEDEIKKDSLYKALEDTCMLSSAVLQSDKPGLEKVKEYIKLRGWENLVEDFDFGFCSHQKLIDILKGNGHTEETLAEVGLIPPKDSTGNYEKYLLEDRLIFPIRNNYGKIIAFASRLITAPKNENDKKYLQSRNTTLYNKNNTLFNLDKARLSDKVYIVEGYADVFTLYKHGIDNVVALCGLSFNDTKYKLLVRNSVKEIVFCLDNDEAGRNALGRIIDKELKNLSGIAVSVKIFPKDCMHKDVDEFINVEGIDAFNELEESTIFEFKLDKLRKDTNDIIIKNDIIQLIVNEEDYTRKESMCNSLSQVIDISTDAIKKEVDRHAKLEKGKYLTTSEDILEEMNCFEKVVNDWDRKIWNRRSTLLGLDAGRFPQFIKNMDGIQNMFYLIAGDTNIGKSALLLNLALDLIESNDDVFVLFFSVDDSISQLLPRMVALDKDIAINTVSNPKFKIQLNEDLSDESKQKILAKRTSGINYLKSISDRFAIKEEYQAKKIEDINKYIQIYKKIAGGKQLVVFVDNLHRISSYKKQDTRELYMGISDSLKQWKTEYDIPVIATAEIRKTLGNKRPVGDDIKEVKDLQFDADVVIMLFSDFYTNKNTTLSFLTEEVLPEGVDPLRPLVELNIIKNKTSSYKKRLYYKFYPEYSKFVEMTEDEIEGLQRSFNS